jgi:opacity protein-like surface antigen
MRTSIASIVTLGLASAGIPAVAGGIAPVVAEPAPVVVAPAPIVTDWSGIYGGLSYSKAMGDIDFGDGSTDFEDGSAPGAFVGYNFQNGAFVYGAELAYQGFNDLKLDGFGGDGVHDGIDLKGRLGYSAGRALPYLALGYSMAKYDDGIDDDIDLDGVSYGLGLDYLVTDNIFVGAEYLKRDMSSDDPDVSASTLGLRVGYKF